MKEKIALIFGYNDYTLEIEKNIRSLYEKIYIFKLNEEEFIKDESKDGIKSFDLSDNWDELDQLADIEECVAFCVLEDMAKNIFLTISLRDTFKELMIIALAQDRESMNKLMLAGASRVIPSTQSTANVIVEMLEKPIVREVLHHILYEKSNLKIAQITVNDDQCFNGQYPADIDWSRDHGVIVLSVVHEDMSTEFIYASKVKHQQIKKGDIFVVVGYDTDIEEFEKLLGRKCD